MPSEAEDLLLACAAYAVIKTSDDIKRAHNTGKGNFSKAEHNTMTAAYWQI